LVGGTQILNTLGSQSIEKQFNNYNLYQNEIKGNIFGDEDNFQFYAYEYYNSFVPEEEYNEKAIAIEDYVNPWLIDHTLL